MGNQADLGLAVVQTLTNFQSTVNSTDSISTINNLSQLIATVTTLIGSPFVAISANAEAALVTMGKIDRDLAHGKPISSADALNLAGNVLVIAMEGGMMIFPVGNAFRLMKLAARTLGIAQTTKYVVSDTHASEINSATSTAYSASRTFIERRDPLALDLDGDGLETTGISGAHPTQFDHDGDGIRTGTGWLQGDDAFLALDRNGNGRIDNGSELFGVDTVLSTGPNAGQRAANGFAALADLDSNHDGHFTALDSHFDSVRLWRDLNQDGLSQADELTTLGAAGITGINLASTATAIALPGGNVQSAAGTYTRNNGQTGSVGEFTTGTTGTTGASGNLDLAQNPFYSTFTDPIPLTAAAEALPGLHGSGRVRELQAQAVHLETLLGVLERFNGLPFVTVGDDAVTTGQGWVISANTQPIDTVSSASGLPVSRHAFVNISAGQRALLEESYEKLKDSVYGGLVLQTRLKPYLDAIALTIDESGIKLDFSGLEAANDLEWRKAA